MQNAILGIRTLNVSQGNYTDYTHKGINALDLCGEDTGKDVWRAKNTWKCTNTKPYSSTGFANTCFFSPCDSQGNLVEINTPSGVKPLTIALTHDNTIRVVKGCIYSIDDYIYMEGTCGNATGNHIHAEATFSFVTEKIKLTGSQYYNGSTWALPNAVPLQTALFLLTGYNVVMDDGGYQWSYVDTVDVKEDVMEINQGYQTITHDGVTWHVYKQKDNQALGLLSAGDYNDTKTIDKIDDEHVHYCKINCNYFDLSSGQHYGVEQGFNCDLAPKDTDYYVVYIQDGKPNYCLSSDYWLNASDVQLAFTPYGILVNNGVACEHLSSGFQNKRYTKTTETMVMQLADGSWCFAVTDTKVLIAQCQRMALSIGAVFMAVLDGGGSSQMIVNGNKVVYTGRAIANVLTMYEKEISNNTDDNTSDSSSDNSSDTGTQDSQDNQGTVDDDKPKEDTEQTDNSTTDSSTDSDTFNLVISLLERVIELLKKLFSK